MKRKRIFSKIIIALLAICMCVQIGGEIIKADIVNPRHYEFEYYEYGIAHEYITDLQPKLSSRSMGANCSSATATFGVHAVGIQSDDPINYNQHKFEAVDVSNGYAYYLGAGVSQYNIYNWAYEWGYNYVGLYCTYNGDAYFWAEGTWYPDY